MSHVESEKLLTLASFTDVIEAKIAQAMLEAEGISCVVQDENIIGMNWMFSTAVGGVKLKVRESDLAEASMLLSADARMEEVPEFRGDVGDTVNEDTHRCPVCGSADVIKEQVSKRVFFLTWIFLGFPLPFFKKTYTCLECRLRFKGSKTVP